MIFICLILEPIEGEPVSFEAKAKKLRGQWKEMFNDLFTHGRKPWLIVAPTPAGIYVLERII